MYYSRSVDNVDGNDDDVMMVMLTQVVRKRRELAVAWLLEEES